MRCSNVPFNFWFVHTPPGGHIEGTSGVCNLNKQKSQFVERNNMFKLLHSPLLLFVFGKQSTQTNTMP